MGSQVVAGAGAGRRVASKIEAVPTFEPRYCILLCCFYCKCMRLM